LYNISVYRLYPEERPMKFENAAEIYRQRFETFRHLNQLRGQMLRIAVGVGSLALALGSSAKAAPAGWVIQIGGIVLIVLAAIIEQINESMRANHKVLNLVGKVVGDTTIPATFRRSTSVAFWVVVLLGLLGFGCLIWGARV